ncbi:MAG: toll/interleukin-1 receptor domain-containing protein [Gemmatimonadales bacterium]
MKVFISYRREDSAHLADRIYDRLSHSFGTASVFKDVVDIPLGADFRKFILDTISACTALIAVIGRHWISGAAGRPRLFDDDDMVCFEIATALGEEKSVIPVLAAGVSMPLEGDLPERLSQLPKRNALVVRPDPDFHRDMDRVVAALAGEPAGGTAEPHRSWFRRPGTDAAELRDLHRYCRGWYDSLVKTRARIAAAESDAKAAQLAYEYVNTRKYLPKIVAIRDAFSVREDLAQVVAGINAFLDLLTTARQEQETKARWSAQLDSLFGQRSSPALNNPLACRPSWVTGIPRGGWNLQDEALLPLQRCLDNITALVQERLSGPA